MLKNKKSFFLFINLALMFILVGVVISFFIFSLERGGSKKTNYEAYAQTRTPLSETDSLQGAILVQSAIRDVANKNMEAVVNISTESMVTQRNPYEEFFGDEFFRRYFGEQPKSERKERSLGSGFLVDEEGYVLSNYHVVKGANKITVKLYNEEKQYPAKLIGYDETYDLALLKIEDKRKFPYVVFGDSDKIEAGDLAIAIGNPFGLNNTVTFGIISAKGRNDVGNVLQNFIQVDVSINPGNSGGPLFNIYGEVIGVNTMIYSTSGGSVGIGFATPINIAKRAIPELRDKGKISRGYLGIFPQDIDETLAKGINVKPYSGVYISEVVVGSPADKANLQDGDIITEIDGNKITKAAEVFSIIAETPIGKQVNMKYIRDGAVKTARVKIEERPTDENVKTIRPNGGIKQSSSNWLGMTIAPITDDIAKQLGVRIGEKGVVVIGFTRDSKAYNSGLKEGDIIKAINGKTINNMDDFKKFAENTNQTSAYTITLKRAKMTYVITVE